MKEIPRGVESTYLGGKKGAVWVLILRQRRFRSVSSVRFRGWELREEGSPAGGPGTRKQEHLAQRQNR